MPTAQWIARSAAFCIAAPRDREVATNPFLKVLGMLADIVRMARGLLFDPKGASMRHREGSRLHSHQRAGMSLIELAVVLAVVSILLAVALPRSRGWSANFNVKDAARAISDSFALARAEAIRTGSNHIVAINGTLGAVNPVEVANDGAPGAGNCLIDAGETVHLMEPVANVTWGTTASLANGAPAPDDAGGSPGTIQDGWSFTDAGGTNAAQWVLFQADGLPRLFTPVGCVIGPAGGGGGAIYVTNGERDYAIVLGSLGTTRIHLWTGSSWRQ